MVLFIDLDKIELQIRFLIFLMDFLKARKQRVVLNEQYLQQINMKA